MLNDSSDNKWKIVTWSRCSKLGFEISRQGYHRIIKLRTSWGWAVPIFMVVFLSPTYLRLSSIFKIIWDRLPLTKIFEFVFHFQNYLRSSSIHLQDYLRLSSIFRIIWGRLPFTKLFEVVFHLQEHFRLSSIYKNIWGHLPFTKLVEVVFKYTYWAYVKNLEKIGCKLADK
jgi:hypothetical protein